MAQLEPIQKNGHAAEAIPEQIGDQPLAIGSRRQAIRQVVSQQGQGHSEDRIKQRQQIPACQHMMTESGADKHGQLSASLGKHSHGVSPTEQRPGWQAIQ